MTESLLKTAAALTAHGFTVHTFQTPEEAADYLLQTVRGVRLAFGGSQTCRDMGLQDLLGPQNTLLSDYNNSHDPAVTRRTREAEVYISSANAISEAGEIVNIDGRGNRVSELLYGPERTIYIIGRNKIAPDLTQAMWRARNIASPLNARRLGKNTPCAKGTELRCYDCASPDRICRGFTVITHKMSAVPVSEVLLIDADLGF